MSTDQSSLERIRAAVDLEEPDRVPVVPLVTYALSNLVGSSVSDYCHDPRKLSDAVIAGYRKFHYDAAIVYADVYLFAEAAGLRLEFPPDSVPKPLQSPITNLEDVERLQLPDPRKDGRLPILLEAIERTSRELPERVAVYSGGQGPFSLAAEIRGLDTFLKDLYLNRPLVEKLIRFSTEYMIELGRAEVEAGAHIIHLGDSFAGPSIVSPRFFRELALPYDRRIFEKWKGFGALTSLHVCGDSSLIWPLVAETKADIFEVDYLVDIARAKDFFKDKLCVMGNIDPAGVIHRGTQEDNERACRSCIEKGASDGGYILSSGCLIMPGFPPQNLDAIVSTARQIGAYCGV